MPLKITAHAGAAIPLGMRGKYGEPKTRISPNILYQQQAAFRQLNLGLYVDHGPIMAGVWYRSKDAFIALIGFQGGKLRERADVSLIVPGQNIEQAEDGHLILNHAICTAIKALDAAA